MNHKTPINYTFFKIKNLLEFFPSENNRPIQTIGKITIPERNLQSVSDSLIIGLDFKNCEELPSDELFVHIYGHINSVNSSRNFIEVKFWKILESEMESKQYENLLSAVQQLLSI